MHRNSIIYRNSTPRWSREEWPFVRRAVLTMACIHLVGLLAVGAVVWHAGGKLESSATQAAQASATDLKLQQARTEASNR